MSVSKEEISKTIIELERSFDERWSAGDNRGYFDPIRENVVVGRDKVVVPSNRAFSQTVTEKIAS